MDTAGSVLFVGSVGISGKRSPFVVRSTMSAGETTEEADKVVEAESPLVMMATTARMTMQPLPR